MDDRNPRANAEEAQRLAEFALDVLSIGGNGEGWTITDAINALRVAVALADRNMQWVEPVSEADLLRLRSFVGDLDIIRTRLARATGDEASE